MPALHIRSILHDKGRQFDPYDVVLKIRRLYKPWFYKAL